MIIPRLFDDANWQCCLESFLLHIYEHSRSEATMHRYRQTLCRFFSRFPARPPDLYTRADVQAFVRQPSQAPRCFGRPPKPGTMNDRLVILSSWYKFCKEFGITNPADGKIYALMPTLPPTAGVRRVQGERAYKVLSEDELRRFFAAIPDTESGRRDKALYISYLYTSRRRSELVSLRWMDIERSPSVGSGFIYRFRGKKAKGTVDVAELPTPAVEAIFSYLAKSGRLATIRDEDPIFITSQAHNGPPRAICNLTAWRAAKRYARLAGIPESRVSPHVFRHTSARMRAENGADVREIQKLLRHTSLAVTDIYLSVLTGAADPGAEKLAARFGTL